MMFDSLKEVISGELYPSGIQAHSQDFVGSFPECLTKMSIKIRLVNWIISLLNAYKTSVYTMQ